jgi:hypothetical protein
MKRLLIAVTMLAASVASAEDCTSASELAPYVGIEGGYRYMNYKSPDHGRDYLPKGSAHYGIFTGLKINEWFGIEVGAHMAQPKKKDGTKMKLNGLHATVLGFLPLMENIHAFAGAGLGHLKLKYTAEAEKTALSKAIPRATAGIEVGITEWLAARASVVWQATRNLKHELVKPKNAVYTNLGLLVKF